MDPNDSHLFEIEPKIKWQRLLGNYYSSQNFQGESEPNGVVINYYLKNDINEPVNIKIYKGAFLINEIEAADTAGINQVVWDMNKKKKRTSKELEEIKSRLQGRRELRESDKFEMIPMPPGEYRVVLTVKGQEFSKKALIMPDHWYDK